MKNLKNLADLLGTTTNWVKENIDEDMIDIIYKLNNKGYKTFACCQGHPSSNGKWNAYIGFNQPYEIYKYPIIDSYKISKPTSGFHGLCLYWSGIGEDSRQEFINQISEWVSFLPQYKEERHITYYLYKVNKRNGSLIYIKSSSNKQEILLEMSRTKHLGYKMKIIERETE